jgi:uncharacterized SAM-binding protein YcdF (DUF218 family)
MEERGTTRVAFPTVLIRDAVGQLRAEPSGRTHHPRRTTPRQPEHSAHEALGGPPSRWKYAVRWTPAPPQARMAPSLPDATLMPSRTPPKSIGRRRWLRVAMLCGTTLGLIGLAIPVAMVLFPDDDTPRSPDGILVLGGVGRERVDLGIELAQRYEVPLVLSSSAMYFANERGYACHLGNALCLPYPLAQSTAEEAQDTLTFVEQQGWDHITVVTSSHHTARARTLFRQCFGDRVTIVGADRPSAIPREQRGLRWAVEGVRPRERLREVVGIIAAVTVGRAC